MINQVVIKHEGEEAAAKAAAEAEARALRIDVVPACHLSANAQYGPYVKAQKIAWAVVRRNRRAHRLVRKKELLAEAQLALKDAQAQRDEEEDGSGADRAVIIDERQPELVAAGEIFAVCGLSDDRFYNLELTSTPMRMSEAGVDDFGRHYNAGDDGFFGNYLKTEDADASAHCAGMHFIDVRQKAFYLTEEIVGVQLAVLDKPMAIATQVLNYDTDWPDWVPKVRAGSKTLTCECVVLPPREFVRLAEEVAGRDRSS